MALSSLDGGPKSQPGTRLRLVPGCDFGAPPSSSFVLRTAKDNIHMMVDWQANWTACRQAPGRQGKTAFRYVRCRHRPAAKGGTGLRGLGSKIPSRQLIFFGFWTPLGLRKFH